MDGLLLIDKPTGITSHDVVARVRRALDERRIGHTGTLDPGASGVLPLVLGRATRLARFLSTADKTYEAVVRLGIETDTYDADGEIVGWAHEQAFPSIGAIDRALDEFRGTFLQQPPAFSAKRIGGRRSYALARAKRPAPSVSLDSLHGRSVDPGVPADHAGSSAPLDLPAPARVTAYSLEILSIGTDSVILRVDCSAGFYVRALAHDLGVRLGTGAHVTALRRTRSGDHAVADAIQLERLERHDGAARRSVLPIVPLSRMLPGLTAVTLNEEGKRRATHGRDLVPTDFIGPPPAFSEQNGERRSTFRLLDAGGNLVGVAEASRARVLHPSIVLM